MTEEQLAKLEELVRALYAEDDALTDWHEKHAKALRARDSGEEASGTIATARSAIGYTSQRVRAAEQDLVDFVRAARRTT